MPMPTGGHWPPDAHAPAYQTYREHHAWYSGDPGLLGEVYRTRADNPALRTRPSQYSGGLVGRVSRWWWGTPPPVETRDPRMHVPAPADVARVSADLLFSEPPTFTVPDLDEAARDTNPTQKWLNEFAASAKTWLLEGAEVAAALGGVYLRPVIDRDVEPDHAIDTVVHADSAIPVFRHGRLVEVTLWTTVEVSGQVHRRLLEHHTRGRVEYACFEGTPTELGKRVPLTEADRDLAAMVDSGSGQDTGVDTLGVVYVPNFGPHRTLRCVPALKHLGRSDFDGAEPLFDRLDEVWSSWMRDIRLGKSRILLPDSFLQPLGPGKGAAFDAEREVFTPLQMLGDPTGRTDQITIAQFEIRVAAHQQTTDALWREILRHGGYDQQTFGDADNAAAAMTATEVAARERRSFVTRDRKLAYWLPGLGRYAHLRMTMEQAHNLPAAKGVKPVVPQVDVGDTVMEDPQVLAQTAQLLKAAEAASTRTLIQLVHPHWTRTQVDEEVQAIEAEKTAAAQRDTAMLADPDQPPDG